MRSLILAQERTGGLRALLGGLEAAPGSALDYLWYKILRPHRTHTIEVRRAGAGVQLGLPLMN